MYGYFHAEVSGKHFNELTEGKTLCKMLNEKWNHNGFQYQLGLNVDINDFSPHGYCSEGGLHFTVNDNIFEYLNYGIHYAIITIPDNARVYIEKKRFKADKINIISVEPFNNIIFSSEVYMAAVKQNGNALMYVKEQTPEICLAAVQQNCSALHDVRIQTPEICLAAVQQNCHLLSLVIEQIPEICMAAVKQNGYLLSRIMRQTPEICMAAVEETGLALEYVKEQTPEICLAAVKQNGLALRYVEEQTPEICMTAVEQNGYALQYARKQTPEICLAAAERNFVNSRRSGRRW